MNRRQRLERRYVAALGISSIVIVSPPLAVGIDASLAPPVGAGAWRRWWCAGEAMARTVVAEFKAAFADRADDLDAAEAELQQCADECGVLLTPDDVVRERAAAVIAVLDERKRALNATGGLKEINRAYKAYRQERLQLGEPCSSYTRFVDQRLEGVLDAIAREVSARV